VAMAGLPASGYTLPLPFTFICDLKHIWKMLVDGDDNRVVENGTETVTVEEDGVVTSKTVSGISQNVGRQRIIVETSRK